MAAKKKAKKSRGRRPMTAAEKKAFVARMAKYRKGKGGAKRNPPGPVPATRTAYSTNPPRPAAKKPAAKRNPPTATQIKKVLRSTGAAIVGGLGAVALLAVSRRLAPDSAAGALNVILPIGAGILATQIRHPDAGAAAAGAFGVAAVGLAGAVASSVLAARNPPVEVLTTPPRALSRPVGWQIVGG